MIGWIGSICFAACGIPQALQCIHQGHARGLSSLCLFLWLAGEVCYVIAVLTEFGWVAWMLTNYVINIMCLSWIIRYKFWPRTS